MVRSAPNRTNMIELSIIIPTYNREHQLRSCLESLSRQTTTDFEVIVVIDGSTDGTRDMLATLTTPYRLRVIEQLNQGQCAALNRGAEAANGHYCLFLDDDIIATPGLVTEHLHMQCKRGGVIAIGQILLSLQSEADWFARCFAQGWSRHYAELNQGVRPPCWEDCYSGNMSVVRTTFLKIRGFAMDLPRLYDLELAYRLERQGLSVVYLPEAIGTQDEHKGFRKLAADSEKEGAAAVELCRRHPSMLPPLLGSFGDAKWYEILLRRILLVLAIPPTLLAPLGSLLRKQRWTWVYHLFLSRYCYWRGVRQAEPNSSRWRRLTYSTPILMYHAFGTVDEAASRFVLSIERFARQMTWLKWMGYHVIKLEEFLRCRHEYQLPPARSVVITIDDGYEDNRTLAYPILRRYGFPATIFVVSGSVGGTNQWDSGSVLTGRSLLSWSQIQEMSKGGMQFGAHTRTHPALTSLSPGEVRQEIEGSRKDLEDRLQVPIELFAYPYGEYDSTTQAVAQQVGFLGSCSVVSGLNTPKTPLHALRRIEIWGSDSLIRFALSLVVGHVRRTFWKRAKPKSGEGYITRYSAEQLTERNKESN
jgi:glycosyltransferase involved in cell wall biosynthesis